MFCPKCALEIKGNDHVQCPVCSSELVELGDGETAENSATEEKESQLSELVDDLHRKLDEGEEAAGDAQPEDDAEPRDDEDITAEEIEYIMDEVDEEIVDESVEEKTSPGRQSRTALIVLGVIVVLAVAAYVLMSGRAPVERPSPTPVVKQRKEVLQKILKRDAQPAAVVVSNDKPADAQLPGVGAVARREVPVTPAAQPAVSKPDAPQETSTLTALRQEVASSQQPGPAVAQDRPDVAVSSQTVSGAPYFTLQVATMSNKQNAVKYYTELKAKGYRVYIVSKSVVPGKVFSKIRIGSFKTQVAAAAVASDLLEKEKITSIIVKSTEKVVTPAPGAVVSAAAVAKPVQPRRYVVHAGSYRNQLHSQHEVDRLLKLGFKAYSEKVDLKQKGTWYRVKVGSFADREKAGVGLKKLQAVDKKISARVVADES